MTKPLSPSYFPNDDQMIFLIYTSIALEKIMNDKKMDIPRCITGSILPTIINTQRCADIKVVGALSVSLLEKLFVTAVSYNIKLTPCMKAINCALSNCTDDTKIPCDNSPCYRK